MYSTLLCHMSIICGWTLPCWLFRFAAMPSCETGSLKSTTDVAENSFDVNGHCTPFGRQIVHNVQANRRLCYPRITLFILVIWMSSFEAEIRNVEFHAEHSNPLECTGWVYVCNNRTRAREHSNKHQFIILAFCFCCCRCSKLNS